MKIKRAFKEACILIDEEDLAEFKDHSKNYINEDTCFFPVGFLPMIQVIFLEGDEKYHLPKIDLDCNYYTKEIYQISQDYLKSLFDENEQFKAERNNTKNFPAEYFWHCIFVNVYRYILYCKNLLENYRLDHVVLIKRSKIIDVGGLKVDLIYFIKVIREYFKHKGVKVRLINSHKGNIPNSTNEKNIIDKSKTLIKSLSMFCLWKINSFKKKNYDYLLISPAYDNKINFMPPFIYPMALVPQVFLNKGIPYYHSLKNVVMYYKDKIKKEKKKENINYKKIPFLIVIDDCRLDISEIFSVTTEKYMEDIVSVREYVNIYWRNCPCNSKLRRIIFSFSPVFIYSYYLIEKIKESNGKVVIWQHGGLSGYADHFIRYILDYKLGDTFLSYGKSHNAELNKIVGEKCDKNYEIGTNLIYSSRYNKLKKFGTVNKHSNGLFFLLGTLENYFQSAIKWDGPAQYKNIKAIIDIFATGEYGPITIKGVKNHKMHSEVGNCIKIESIKNVYYTDRSLNEAILSNPKFIILDGVSTTLLEVITKYRGFVFVLNCQETWKVAPEALSLLKKRVFYSESVDQLKMHLEENLIYDKKGVPPQDNSFRDNYIKPFSYERYQQFMSSIKC